MLFTFIEENIFLEYNRFCDNSMTIATSEHIQHIQPLLPVSA